MLGAGLAQNARPRSRGSLAMLAAIAILVLAALGASVFAGAPWPLSLSSAGTLLAALLVLAVGACVARAGLGISAFRAFCIGLVVAGIASSAIGLIQVLAPQLADGDWIALASIRRPRHRQRAPAQPPEQPAALVGGGGDLAGRGAASSIARSPGCSPCCSSR